MVIAVGGAAIVSALDLVLKVNMSRVRITGAAARVGASEEAVKALVARFTRWHDLQLNIAEYTPTFVVLMVRTRRLPAILPTLARCFIPERSGSVVTL